MKRYYNNYSKNNKTIFKKEVLIMAKTKKELFAEIKNAVADNAEWVAFLEHEIELLNKKRPSVNSKAKAEAEARENAVYEALAVCDKPVTVTELISLAPNEVSTYTNQRVSALLRKLGDDKINKEIVKGKSYFSVK